MAKVYVVKEVDLCVGEKGEDVFEETTLGVIKNLDETSLKKLIEFNYKEDEGFKVKLTSEPTSEVQSLGWHFDVLFETHTILLIVQQFELF